MVSLSKKYLGGYGLPKTRSLLKNSSPYAGAVAGTPFQMGSARIGLKNTFKCKQCKKTVKRKPSAILKTKDNFCSKECQNKYIRKNWKVIKCKNCKKIIKSKRHGNKV